LVNDFIKTSEREMIPALESLGALLIRKTSDEIAFCYRGIELSICRRERKIEIYGVVSLPKFDTVYVAEVLKNYLNDKEKGVYFLSDRFPMELCIKRFTEIMAFKIFPLINDGRITEAVETITLKRKEGLRKYKEGLIEIKAEKAFIEKRYNDVISLYAEIKNLTDIQRKRLDISKRKTV